MDKHSDAACDEASRLFHIYLGDLNQFQELTDRIARMRPLDMRLATVRVNLDLAYNTANEARKAYLQHCNEHGCRS